MEMDWWTAFKSNEPVEPMRWRWRLPITLGFLVSVVGWMVGVLPPICTALMNAIFIPVLMVYNARQRRLGRVKRPADNGADPAGGIGTKAGSFVRRHRPRRDGSASSS